MTGEITKRKMQGIKKAFSRDYLADKEKKKQLRREKASRPKSEKHKSRQQLIDEMVETEIELEGGIGNEAE